MSNTKKLYPMFKTIKAKILPTIFVVVYTIATNSVTVAQSERLDSLLNLLPKAKEDTNKTWLYEDIGMEYQYSGNTEKALEFYRKQIELSKKLNYLTGEWRGTVGYCDMLTWSGQYDTVLLLYENIRPKIEASSRKDLMMKLNTNLGMAHDNKGHFELAVDYLLKALHECEKNNDEYGMGKVNALLQLTYMRLDFYEKAIASGEQAIKALKGSRDYIGTLANLGEVYMSAGNHQKAEEIFLEVIKLTEEEPDMFSRSLSLTDLGSIYFDKKEYEKAEKLILESLDIFTMADYSFGLVGAMYMLGQIEFQKKNFKKSEEWTLKSLEIAERDLMYTNISHCLYLLSDIDIVNGNYQSMLQRRKLADSIDNIVVNNRIRQTSEELSIKYETEKKQLKIQSLEEEKHLSRIIMIISIILMLLIFTASVFIVLWTRQRRKRAEIKIKQLEQEKQLVATQAVLSGEVQERSRLSRDLHDGLGSMLTGVKLNLETLKDGIILKSESVKHFDTAMNILNDSIVEMRRVAHHLMPDTLNKSGLKTALQDFCNSFPNIEFSWFGNEERLDDQKKEIMIYRIIHELVNNSLKHSGATKIGVNIMKETDYIAFTVFDDGCGFDTEVKFKGIGLENIRERVASVNGRMVISSELGKGTEINVEFKN